MFKRRQTISSMIDVGLLLNGRYRLVEEVGKGGAGVIYKAEDEQLKRVVAIKLLTSDGDMAADKLERFRSEARSVARLNHPNIITLFDYAETDGHPYLVIEYVPGQDLWELDNSYSPELMPFETSLPIIDGVLAALEYSHAHQVIHRDLKPENMMITPAGQVKVMDFGLARIEGQSRLTQDGLVAGTASYLAPELALGEPGDHRVDLYAQGVIMYELFTGRRPFSGDDPLTVISQHIHAPVVPPQHYNPNIPDDLQAIVLKLMAKEPEARYASATEVRQDLAPILLRYQGGAVDTASLAARRVLALETTTTQEALLDRISRGKMVGRETELAELKRRWDMARYGEPSLEPLILISGEAGIGKTRLLRELQVYAGLRDGYVLHGTAREQEAGTPYAILANALRNYVREQSTENLRRQTPGFIAGEVVKLAPQLAEKIGYIAPNPALEPEAERARLLEQLSKFLLNMAHEQSTLLLLDDLHFADPGSLDVLETLIRHASGTSLLIAGAYRDVALSYSSSINHLIFSMESARLAYQVPLRRLPRAMVEQQLEMLLGDAISEDFIDGVYNATEGNPLFVEEVIKGLATDGQLILKDGRWARRDSDRLHVPGSIKSVLGARIKRVDKQTLDLLQLAAVIGRNFSLDLITAGSGLDDGIIGLIIEEVLRLELIAVDKIIDRVAISPDKSLTIHYQFQHALIRETLYEELRPLRRRRLHRKIAKAIERLVADEMMAPAPSVLAHHLIEGALEEQAVPYLRQAGEASYRVYANKEALDLLGQAREILEDLAHDLSDAKLRDNLIEQFDLLFREWDLHNLIGDSELELQALESLQVVAEAVDDRKRWVDAKSRLANYFWRVGKLTQAEEFARQALKVAQQHNDRDGELYCLEQIARVLWTRRDADSMSFAAQALQIAQDLGDRQREGRLTELVGHIYTDTLHDPERAGIYFNQALAICRETENLIEEAWTLWGMGGLALFVDDYPRALQHYEAARKISEDIGATLQVGWDLYHMGDAWYNLGDLDRARDHYDQAQVIFNAAQHRRGKIDSLISLGLVLTASGQREEAGTYLEQGMRLAEEREDLILMFRSYQALAAYHVWLGGDENLAYAVRLSNRIIRLAGEGDHFEPELLGYHLRGASFFALDELDEALKSSKIAVDQLEQLTYLHSSQISVAEIYYTYSRILDAFGHADLAHTYWQKALDETMRKADLIEAPQQRRDFLDKVPLNREILAAGGLR
ncbi:MAG TPA: protein kinase [Anaerolineae bacterium]